MWLTCIRAAICKVARALQRVCCTQRGVERKLLKIMVAVSLAVASRQACFHQRGWLHVSVGLFHGPPLLLLCILRNNTCMQDPVVPGH